MSIDRGMGKENVDIYITDYYTAIKKKKEILSFVTTGRYASEIS